MADYRGFWSYEYVDVNGDTAMMRLPFNLVDTKTIANIVTSSAALGALIDPLTNAKNIKVSASIDILTAQLLVGTTPPNNAEYSSVVDGARLQFSNSVRERMSSTIPAPLESIFGASSNIVDMTNTDVAAFIAGVAAQCAGGSLNSFNLYEGGVKVGRGARRRRNPRVP
jgi:hypothetical protein